MKWIETENLNVPIKSWCEPVEKEALKQAQNLANHPAIFKHIALMPDCHVGYGMPIGGVIACQSAVIPNAVGVDIGCGMGAVETNIDVSAFHDKSLLRELTLKLKERIPVGEGHSRKIGHEWSGFGNYLERLELDTTIKDFKDKRLPLWLNEHGWELDHMNLGTLGGGNHFIEVQEGNNGKIWLMLHSGSRNLGHRIASYYHQLASELNSRWKIALPDKSLAYLPVDADEGKAYIRDMSFALTYAAENRRLMMEIFKETVSQLDPKVEFTRDINIHHNYAAIENHFGRNVWIHRKGATSAREKELGIIPGSMGTASYIVEGLGNSESFMSCSHGAGRTMGRSDANRSLKVEDCDKAMEGIVYDRWKKSDNRGRKKEKLLDLSESPLAYKNIDKVIESELDLIKPVVKLRPLAVVKG